MGTQTYVEKIREHKIACGVNDQLEKGYGIGALRAAELFFCSQSMHILVYTYSFPRSSCMISLGTLRLVMLHTFMPISCFVFRPVMSLFRSQPQY
jgi:hypothetical protein